MSLELKRCSKCKLTKELTAFGKNKSREDGLQTWCLACRKAGYENNKQVILAKHKDKYKEDPEFRIKKLINAKKRAGEKPEEIALYRKEYYAENRGWLLEEKREYSRVNSKAAVTRINKWRQDNLERARKLSIVKEARRRTRKTNAGGYFSKEDIDKIYKEQDGKCYYCQVELNNIFDVDHKIPVSREGTSWPENLCCACIPCNRSKHNRTDIEFIKSLRDKEINCELQ